MNLVKEQWQQPDYYEFLNYLKSLGNPEKVKWSANILNTQMQVLAIATPVMKNIAKDILKGNFLSFLNLKIFENYESTVVYGSLLTKIEDFELMTKHLNIYLQYADNWAHCDLLSFNINSNNKSSYINLAKEFLTSEKTFTRRTGLIILLQMVKDEKVLPVIFHELNKLTHEKEYYVNMAGGWLLCECFIKHKPLTIEFLKHNSVNKQLINKAIQKCRDSFRVSAEDKQALLAFKK